jgi:hypothetical protein
MKPIRDKKQEAFATVDTADRRCFHHREEAGKHKENSDKYKLFIGFRKLGGFGSISEAKRYAQESGLAGVFNLLGDSYRDAWYVFECKTKKEETVS